MTKSSKLTPNFLNKEAALIGVFDSGIGGLSILKEIHKLIPSLPTIYLADQANFPYGNKTLDQIKAIASQNVERLMGLGVQMIVIACNTATVNTISFLRKKFPQIIFVGTEPAIKPAGLLAKKGIIVLSSPQATKSKQLTTLLRKYARKANIFNIGSLELVSAIENGVSRQKIKTILKKELPSEILLQSDVLVLGCTHFPLVKNQIQNYVGDNIQIIDSGQSIAKRTLFLLHQNKFRPQSPKPKNVYLTTGKSKQILGYSFESI